MAQTKKATPKKATKKVAKKAAPKRTKVTIPADEQPFKQPPPIEDHPLYQFTLEERELMMMRWHDLRISSSRVGLENAQQKLQLFQIQMQQQKHQLQSAIQTRTADLADAQGDSGRWGKEIEQKYGINFSNYAVDPDSGIMTYCGDPADINKQEPSGAQEKQAPPEVDEDEEAFMQSRRA